MDKIIERLMENRNKRIDESVKINPEYKRKIEDILNHQLGDYESRVNVLELELVSQTPELITYTVEYEVGIRIPVFNQEDNSTYYEDDVEYRTRTMTIDK